MLAGKRILFADFETYYDKDYSLRKIPTPNYILDPRFECIMCAVKWWTPEDGTGPTEIVDGPDFSSWIKQYDPKVTATVTFNSAFDNAILFWRYNFLPSLIIDTMGMARALCGHMLERASLEYVAKALGIGAKGGAIHKVIGMHRADIIAAGLWPEFCSYAALDNELSAGIFAKLIRAFPESEQRLMDLVLRCTIDPKFRLNMPMLATHLTDVRANKESLIASCGTDKTTLMSANKFKEVLEARGVEIEYKTTPTGKQAPAFAKTDAFMEELAAHDDPVVQALAAARLGLKSTLEETRCEKILSIGGLQFPDGFGFMPIPLRYGGAHTHRLSGDWGLNMQNMPRGSNLRRGLVCADDETIIVADLSQIEARLVAWICKCAKLVKQFGSGEDVYATFASMVFGFPVNKDEHPVHRFIGKTGVLGLGYACGADKFYSMVVKAARQYGIDLAAVDWTLQRAQATVFAYRSGYQQIPAGWRTLDHAISNILCVQSGATMNFGPVTVSYGQVMGPNDMALNYFEPHFDAETQEYIFKYGKFWHKLYGAKLLENIVQYLARIIVMNAALRLEGRGYRFRLQAHDELAFIVKKADFYNAKQIIHQEMIRRPSWGRDIPLAAEVSKKPSASYGEAK